MRYLQELVAAVRTAHPGDNFFRNFKTSLARHPLKRKYFEVYERALQCLDENSWGNLRTKAVDHFHESRGRQLKAPFFDQLNDAFAYRWLVHNGFSNVTILSENRYPKSREKRPDLTFCMLGRLYACDVKTIGVSDAELDRRQSAPTYYDRSNYQVLAPGFFKKIDDAIEKGAEQIVQCADAGLIFIVVHGDDFTSTFHAEHRAQLTRHLRKHAVPVLVKFGVHGQRRIEHTASLFTKNAA